MRATMSTVPTGLIRLRIQLVYPEVVVIQACLFIAMVWRGLDYVSPPDEEVSTLTAVEQALPFTTWGTFFLLGGLLGLAGLHYPRWPLTAFAHYIAVTLYAGFSFGAFISILDRIEGAPSLLAMAWIAVLMSSGVITWGVVHHWMPEYRSMALVGIALALIGSLVILASSSGVYGWRTATGWLFVQCVAHLMMARASTDAWNEQRQRPEITVEEAPRDVAVAHPK
ncbi:membrane protein [Gordonia phage Lilbeanie]|uniref:Membrane protein n=1 Tax=Gordonia phage Lilbeanie TaxID=2794947 RepID=A0A7T1NWX6_9CAUD|nr:minor tail protein [Gordonia phage Lilbeanie]QPO17120.1 membrane protein [Gordonia phage Lilbeanie]